MVHFAYKFSGFIVLISVAIDFGAVNIASKGCISASEKQYGVRYIALGKYSFRVEFYSN